MYGTPGQLGPWAQLSGAKLSALRKWTIGPRTVGPQLSASKNRQLGPGAKLSALKSEQWGP